MNRIIVSCDGTSNADDEQTDDTNVAILARAIHGSQQTGGILQIVLYLRGVGTKVSVWMTISARPINSSRRITYRAMRSIFLGSHAARLPRGASPV